MPLTNKCLGGARSALLVGVRNLIQAGDRGRTMRAFQDRMQRRARRGGSSSSGSSGSTEAEATWSLADFDDCRRGKFFF